ncbi:hypothetical protein AUK11_01550 [bacterium CG2_30_37_16]|nr:MAG: hypothetical protein AUK11_01550 [bacterium CG2_30_37_16]PIP30694.1 MAG: hypothetical protein COX25_03375 [bacterium (Candidatus Howlettbacteria) CG23_combo_of_CG06-09_8_20_14_all_37_9]PJB05639.1 MAG: hypothetical protein CO123_03690 [bacterium (Candidatus Howlettbacteria) CG_4_9_14_3_um_filter_37_10]
MVITRLTQGKKNKNRANIYLDGQYSFSISLDNLVSFSLKTGDELTEEKLSEIKNVEGYLRAYDRALTFISYRKRSEKEVKDKLNSLEFEEDVVEKTIARLKKNSFIDDVDFTLSWIVDRNRLKPTSRKILFMELLAKGIQKSIIENELAGISDEEELENAKKVAAKKRTSLKNDPEKIKKYLYSKGYSWDVAKEVAQNNDE